MEKKKKRFAGHNSYKTSRNELPKREVSAVIVLIYYI